MPEAALVLGECLDAVGVLNGEAGDYVAHEVDKGEC